MAEVSLHFLNIEFDGISSRDDRVECLIKTYPQLSPLVELRKGKQKKSMLHVVTPWG